ncbi:phospholipid phosphatase-related protein type 5-like isoform X1 [Stegostoma tigrinum]|uniref:phospholipid phosphatase-related protein type 5-like isoform X1 n=1 Tax=Stegostoma tigrinum TaxID=3053191 RepID=UPI00202AC9FF|nr:phospholipid phosphatase-related protein type 5-like isoform X1 [Stegostoma tigrinum]
MPREESDVRRNDSIIPCFICVELVIMVGTVLLTYYLEFTDIFSVHRQGFFCFDSTYTKPYPGPEETSLLPPVLLQSLASAVPMTTIAFGELAAFVFQAELVREERTIVTADCCSLNPLLRRVVRFLGVYAFGLCTTDIFVNAGQVVTGSPAPHFMTVCQPNYTALGCQLSTQFISSENACTGSPGVVSSARRAFPCKDSALTMYAAVYTVMYVTIMFQAKGTRLTKPMLCLTILCLTFLTGVVRVSEFRSHWSDVLVGFLTGGAVAVFLVCCVLHNFKSLNSSQENPRNVREPVCVKLALPCVESPLEKIAQLHSQKVRDRTSGIFPSTPDVLIATQSVMSEV